MIHTKFQTTNRHQVDRNLVTKCRTWKQPGFGSASRSLFCSLDDGYLSLLQSFVTPEGAVEFARSEPDEVPPMLHGLAMIAVTLAGQEAAQEIMEKGTKRTRRGYIS